jgi:hypothetical protein
MDEVTTVIQDVDVSKKQRTKFTLSYPDDEQFHSVWVGRLTEDGFTDLMKSPNVTSDDGIKKWFKRSVINHDKHGNINVDPDRLVEPIVSGYSKVPSKLIVNNETVPVIHPLDLHSHHLPTSQTYEVPGIYFIIEYDQCKTCSKPEHHWYSPNPFDPSLLQISRWYGICFELTYDNQRLPLISQSDSSDSSESFDIMKLRKISVVYESEQSIFSKNQSEKLSKHFSKSVYDHLQDRYHNTRELQRSWYDFVFPSWINGFETMVRYHNDYVIPNF